MYKLCEALSNRREAFLALKFMFLFPAAFFFFAPLTESLFMFLSITMFYFAIKKRPVGMFICGVLLSLSRLQGLLMLIPVVFEMIVNIRASKSEADRRKAVLHGAAASFALLLGFAVYLLINLLVYGNMFQFLIYQKENWHQSLSYFWNTAKYIPEYAAGWRASGETGYYTISIPTIAAMIISLTAILLSARRLRPSLTLYAMAYFMISFGATWLLSGARYTLCMFPIVLVATKLSAKNKIVNYLLTGAFILMYSYYCFMFMAHSTVY